MSYIIYVKVKLKLLYTSFLKPLHTSCPLLLLLLLLICFYQQHGFVSRDDSSDTPVVHTKENENNKC